MQGHSTTNTHFPPENRFSTISRGFPCGKLVKTVENYKITIVRIKWLSTAVENSPQQGFFCGKCWKLPLVVKIHGWKVRNVVKNTGVSGTKTIPHKKQRSTPAGRAAVLKCVGWCFVAICSTVTVFIFCFRESLWNLQNCPVYYP